MDREAKLRELANWFYENRDGVQKMVEFIARLVPPEELERIWAESRAEAEARMRVLGLTEAK